MYKKLGFNGSIEKKINKNASFRSLEVDARLRTRRPSKYLKYSLNIKTLKIKIKMRSLENLSLGHSAAAAPRAGT